MVSTILLMKMVCLNMVVRSVARPPGVACLAEQVEWITRFVERSCEFGHLMRADAMEIQT